MAERMHRYRMDKEELIGTLMDVVKAKETMEGRERLEIARYATSTVAQPLTPYRRIFTSHGATHGWTKMKDLLKFSDQSVTETLGAHFHASFVFRSLPQIGNFLTNL